jgi:transposase
MKIFVYYDQKSEAILDFFPADLSEMKKNDIREMWSQEIPKRIIMMLSKGDEVTAPIIKQQIGHSMSTLHENIKKLEQTGIIETKMIYKGNKQKIIKTNVLCVSRNTPLTQRITRFLNQGLWIDTSRSKKIVNFLEKNPDQYFSIEEISAKTGIQVDEVQTLLENWDNQITRAFSDFLKKRPFEKKTLYRAKH